MKYRFITSLYFLLCINNYFAQTGNPVTDALLDSARNYVYSNKIKSYRFAAELKEKATGLKNNTAIAYAHHIFGVFDENHGDNETAFKNYSIALDYANRSGDKIARLRILTALSNYYIHLSQFDKCIEICHQGIKEATTIGNNEITSQFYNNLSLAHSYIKEYNKALIYSDKSIEIKKGLKDDESLANAYLNRGLLLTEMGKYEEGFRSYSQAEKLYERTNAFHALTQTHINFAWDYTNLKEYKKARAHLTRALYFAEKSDDKIRQAGAWNAFGYYYKNAGYTDSVAYALNKGLQLSIESENKRNAQVAYQQLAEHYQNIGKVNMALENLKNAYQLKDSIFDESKIQLAQSLNARYETEQKEEQIKLLSAQQENNNLTIQKQRWSIIAISLLVVLTLTLSYFLFYRYQKRQKSKKERELQIQKEMERIRIARDMHDEIGAGLTRIVMRSDQVKLQLQSGKELKNSLEESIEKIASESRLLSHNIGEIIWALNPKNDTLDNLFSYIRNYAYDYMEETGINCSIYFPDKISTTPISPELRRNVFLIIKEALNNIVKHSSAKNVEIILTISENHFSIAIKDNGKGMATKSQTSGNGLDNMKKRADECGGNFNINAESGKGLSIFIEDVPFQNPTKV